MFNLEIPVLIIHGKHDSIFPLKYVKEMADRMKNTEIKIIPNGDHILVVNNYKVLIKIIDNFLNFQNTEKGL